MANQLAVDHSLADEGTTFVESLRQRQLGRLAEVWIDQRLADPEVEARKAAALVGQRAQVHVDRALAAPRAERDQHWQVADAVIDKFVADRTDQPVWVLLRLQQALIATARGEIERLEAQSQGESAATQAARTLRAATRRLETVTDEIEQQRAARSRRSSSDETFTEGELASLANRVACEQAEALLQTARCYPPQSPDRDDALLRAAEIARRLTSQSLPIELLWRARLSLSASERLLGRAADAATRLTEWEKAEPPLERFLADIAAERLRLLQVIDPQKVQPELASLPPKIRSSASVQLAELESIATRWRQATAAGKRSQLAATIQQRVAELLNQHGRLTALRGEAIAGAALTVEPAADGSLATLIANAEFLYRSGRFEKAVDAYDRAAAGAYRDGARGRSFELSLTAAAILQSQQQWAEASQRFRRAALVNSTHPSAPIAHRTAAVCLSQVLRASENSGADDRWDEYTQLLSEHLATWPDAPTTSEVRWWLIDSLVARNAWRRVASVVSEVATDDPRRGEAAGLLGEAWQAIVRQQVREGDAARIRAAISQATDALQAEVLGVGAGSWPDEWRPSQRAAALAIARLRLTFGDQASDASYARKMLSAAVSGSPPPEQPWLTDAATLLAAALVEQGELSQTAEWIKRHPPASREPAELLLRKLRQRITATPSDQQTAGALMLVVLDGLPDRLPGEADVSWQLPLRAAALVATGQQEQALAAAREVATQEPDDPAAQERLAGLLAGRPGEVDQRAALAIWRKLEDRSRGGTPRWFRARLARIRLMSQLGEREAARKLLQLTRVLHPKLGGMAQEFESAAQNP